MSQRSEGTSPARESVQSVFAGVFNASFLEKCLLLLLTAALSGFIIPLVVKSIDAARERNDSLDRARVKLFEDVSETVLTYESLILDVSWFGTTQAANPAQQRKAFERYTERTVDITARWRVQISRAYAFASPEVADKLHELLGQVFREQDTPMNEMWNKCQHKCDWDAQHAKSVKVLGSANGLIRELAGDLGLKRDSRAGKGA